MELLNRCGYDDVYGKYRKASGNAVYDTLATLDGTEKYLLPAQKEFDVMSDKIVMVDGETYKELTNEDIKSNLGELGVVLSGARSKYEMYKSLTETDIKGFIFKDNDLENINKRLDVISKLAGTFDVNIDLSKAKTTVEVANTDYTVKIDTEGNETIITDAGNVTLENFSAVLAVINGMKAPPVVDEVYQDVDSVNTAIEAWEKVDGIKAAAEKAAAEKAAAEKEATDLMQNIGNVSDVNSIYDVWSLFVTGGKLTNIDNVNDITEIKSREKSIEDANETIKAVNAIKEGNDLVTQIDADMTAITENNEKLGEKTVNVDSLTQKIEEAKEAIEAKKKAIEEEKKDEEIVEEKKDEETVEEVKEQVEEEKKEEVVVEE